MKTLFLNKQLNENSLQRRTNERQNFWFGYIKLIDLFEKVIICNWKNVVKAATELYYSSIEYYCWVDVERFGLTIQLCFNWLW